MSVLQIAEEVAAALAEDRPVVALESSLVAHGLPSPHNLETAREAERAVRREGAVPATVAVVGGRLVIGADDALLERLADPAERAAKAASRDLGPLLAAGRLAATTVGATMRAAHAAGIRLFATGGIGGVHRGAAETWDVSSDIDELAATPVAVVCSGAKAILDLPATLELLETRRIPVIGLGTDEFPAFFSAVSGLLVPHRVESPELAAAAVAAHFALHGGGGMLLCQPPPAGVRIPPSELDGLLDDAVRAARRARIVGGAVTPWLLARLAERSGGRTLDINVALLVENARTAAQVAVALARLDGARA